MSLTNLIKEKSEERQKLHNEAGDILKKAQDEKRSMTAEEEQEFDRRHADMTKLDGELKRYRQQLESESTIVAPQADNRSAGREDSERQPTEADHKAYAEKRDSAFRKFLRSGYGELTPEERTHMKQERLGQEERILVTSVPASLGLSVAPDTSFYAQIVQAQKELGLDESQFRVLNTSNGAPLPVPVMNDTENEDAGLHEEAQDDVDDATDPIVSQVTFGAYTRKTGVIEVSYELLQDAAVDVESLVGRLMGERVARTKARLLTNGLGSGDDEPEGIVTGSDFGTVAASASAVTADEILDLIHSVDPAYRRMGMKLMMHDQTMLAIKKLKDEHGQYLYLRDIASPNPDTFNGYPIVLNNNMPQMAMNARTIIAGDFKSFWIRNVRGLTIMRLDQHPYANRGTVGFLGFYRFDSKVINAGTGPIKFLSHITSS